MHVFSEALWVACNNYQAMQEAHLHGLATDPQPDMERLVFERAHLFADLQNHLTALAYQCHTAVPEPALCDALRARLTALLESDAVLAERLHAYRLTLAQQRAAVQQGQKALAGYGGLATALSPWCVSTSG